MTDTPRPPEPLTPRGVLAWALQQRYGLLLPDPEDFPGWRTDADSVFADLAANGYTILATLDTARDAPLDVERLLDSWFAEHETLTRWQYAGLVGDSEKAVDYQLSDAARAALASGSAPAEPFKPDYDWTSTCPHEDNCPDGDAGCRCECHAEPVR